jgi:hypothetical protein
MLTIRKFICVHINKSFCPFNVNYLINFFKELASDCYMHSDGPWAGQSKQQGLIPGRGNLFSKASWPAFGSIQPPN